MNKNGGAKKAALGISYPVVGRTKNMVTKKSEMTAPFAMANLAWALPSRTKAQVRPMTPKPHMKSPEKSLHCQGLVVHSVHTPSAFGPSFSIDVVFNSTRERDYAADDVPYFLVGRLFLHPYYHLRGKYQ